jgi:hypothetical protein
MKVLLWIQVEYLTRKPVMLAMCFSGVYYYTWRGPPRRIVHRRWHFLDEATTVPVGPYLFHSLTLYGF